MNKTIKPTNLNLYLVSQEQWDLLNKWLEHLRKGIAILFIWSIVAWSCLFLLILFKR